MRNYKFISILMALALPAVAYAPRETLDPAVVERGRKQFVSSCGFCHGDDATGNRAPDLVRSAMVNHDKSGDLIGPVIRAGRPDKGMPGFPFTDAQIADVAAFLRFRTQEALGSGHVPRDYPLAKLLTGSADAGKAYFDGVGGCAGCHSTSGDLAGVAKKYSPLMLQQRLLAPRGPPSTATVTPRAGGKFEGTLVHIDEFEVAIRDGAGWYRSWPRDEANAAVHDPLEKHRELITHYSDVDVHNLFAYLETLK